MSAPHQNRLDIHTPEGITFSTPVAGIPSRCVAWLIDSLLFLSLLAAASLAFAWLEFAAPSIGLALQILLFFLLSAGYNIAFEWLWRGQTPGKRLLRLRVIDAQGLRMQFSQIAIRNLLRAVDLLPGGYGVGVLALLLSPKGQRLGDLAANTVVVRTPKLTEPDLDQLASGIYNSFRGYPHLEARLRQRVPTEEVAILTQALLRRETLDPDARVSLYTDMAEHFRTYADFPEDATRGLTDEQYLRNVAESLFRRAGSAPQGQ